MGFNIHHFNLSSHNSGRQVFLSAQLIRKLRPRRIKILISWLVLTLAPFLPTHPSVTFQSIPTDIKWCVLNTQ